LREEEEEEEEERVAACAAAKDLTKTPWNVDALKERTREEWAEEVLAGAAPARAAAAINVVAAKDMLMTKMKTI